MVCRAADQSDNVPSLPEPSSLCLWIVLMPTFLQQTSAKPSRFPPAQSRAGTQPRYAAVDRGSVALSRLRNLKWTIGKEIVAMMSAPMSQCVPTPTVQIPTLSVAGYSQPYWMPYPYSPTDYQPYPTAAPTPMISPMPAPQTAPQTNEQPAKNLMPPKVLRAAPSPQTTEQPATALMPAKVSETAPSSGQLHAKSVRLLVRHPTPHPPPTRLRSNMCLVCCQRSNPRWRAG